MERMSKAFFWHKIMQRHPLLMHDFRTWLDEYKRRSGWPLLFNAGEMMNYGRTVGDNLSHHDPKYHDLPQAMQIGIFMQYTVENGGADFCCSSGSMASIIQGIIEWFDAEAAMQAKQ